MLALLPEMPMMLHLCLSSSAILFGLVTTCVLCSWCSSGEEESQQAQQQGAGAPEAAAGGTDSQGGYELEEGSQRIAHGAAEASDVRHRCLLGFILEFISQHNLSANTTLGRPDSLIGSGSEEPLSGLRACLEILRLLPARVCGSMRDASATVPKRGP